MNRPSQKIPGYNVDRINVAAGLRELKTCGYDEPKTTMVIEYALVRWARGEEKAAQRGAIDRSFHGALSAAEPNRNHSRHEPARQLQPHERESRSCRIITNKRTSHMRRPARSGIAGRNITFRSTDVERDRVAQCAEFLGESVSDFYRKSAALRCDATERRFDFPRRGHAGRSAGDS